MLHDATGATRNSLSARGRSAKSDPEPRSLQVPVCAACDSSAGNLVYGRDPDGFVLCRECRSPIFYCDLGGQG